MPRASAGIAYGLVTVAFLWQLFGSLLGAPKWLVDLTPFAHVGLVPVQPFRVGAAVVMLGIGAVAAVAAVAVFRAAGSAGGVGPLRRFGLRGVGGRRGRRGGR